MTQDEIKEIKNIAEELLQKMSINDFSIELKSSLANSDSNSLQILDGVEKEGFDSVGIDIKLKEPQILIGQNGQTLFGLERILRIILNKKLRKNFYLKLDINDYKRKKIDYLKKTAKETADQVSLTKISKVLPPMMAYERRIIHMELSKRRDIKTESRGEGNERSVVVNPAA